MSGRALAGWLAILLAGASHAADAPTPMASEGAPSVAAVLERVGFSEADRAHVLAGETAERGLDAAGKHDIGIALALLLPAPVGRVTHQIVEGAAYIREDPNTIEYGVLPEGAGVEDFAELVLEPSERAVYRSARAGEDTNFSEQELATLARGGDEPTAIDAALREVLIGRLRAYRRAGLNGIAPYARGHGHQTEPGAALRRATRASPRIADLDAGLARFLEEYPAARPRALREAWHWIHYRAHGSPSVLLVHTFAAPLGSGTAVVQRQFYVTRGYNAEQAVAAFMPVREGTLAVYWNHTSTDQVGGFGASVERAVGQRLMARQLESLFDRIRKQVDGD